MSLAQPKAHSQLDDIRHLIESHHEWLQSGGRNGRRANFSGMDFQGVDLRGCYLPEANFRAANLRGVDISGSELQGADFSEAIIESANFSDSKLDGANFTRARGNGAYFMRASMVGANLTASSFEEADLSQTKLAASKCREMLATRTIFTYADFDCAIMRYMNATEANFDGANLSQADCRDGVFQYAKFKESNVAAANFRKANLDQVSFSHANFSKAVELDPTYHIRSIEEEKREVKEELKNLQTMREEIGMYEQQINEQKKQIRLKRRIMDGLNDMEQEVGDSLSSYMKIFRFISIFWFTVIALVGTLLLYRASSLGVNEMTPMEIVVMSTLILGVLGAHVISAILSHTMSRRFASYVRMRHEKLGMLGSEQQINLKTGDRPVQMTLGESDAPKPQPTVQDDTGVVYL
ncbi:MAG: pentapeptide repeat-containing protein [Rickettsiales bacterium]|nr:pentapeptide repeat-containing protein [Rickettsiales bacterium]